ncbi:MAG: GIY-YIG nuclease family protein [Candidatus Sungbacteria bacterium]|nr:GIY-YIG nuclease family protein [Candidatus Sungbacteria bacterium]
MLKKPKNTPTYPGVYIFWKGHAPLYVGKATNLKKRVSSYFKKNAGWKVAQLIEEATQLEFIKAESEIEALVKEAELIKKYYPKFNILMRDDKNYLYVSLTSPQNKRSNVLKNLRTFVTSGEAGFPRFYFTHQPERDIISVGPFVESGSVYQAMRLLRSIFPYCTCKSPHNGRCVNAQIGRCPGYCCIKGETPTSEQKAEYLHNVRSILSIFSGKRNSLLKEFKREMKRASQNQEYEKAAKLRDRIYGLELIWKHRGVALQKRAEVPYRKIERVLQTILKTREPIRRIEGYDISNISGTDATGSMVVFYEGRPDKSQYRKFKIKTIAGANDVGSHREILSRRLAHEEWEYPDLILIDGGKPQLNAVLPILNRRSFQKIKVAALAKPPRRYFSRAPSGLGYNEDILWVAGRENPIKLKSLPSEVMYLLQRIRDESHRFAKSYHGVLRKKTFSRSR